MKLSKFRADSPAAVEGVWYDLGDGARVRVARWNNPRFLKARQKSATRGGMLTRQRPDFEEAEALLIDVVAETILLDWQGFVEDDGETAIPYSIERAKQALIECRDFYDQIISLSQSAELFASEQLEDAGKN
jgi:hypothetical protein